MTVQDVLGRLPTWRTTGHGVEMFDANLGWHIPNPLIREFIEAVKTLAAECLRLERRNAELTASEERMALDLRVAQAEVKLAWSEHKKVKDEFESLAAPYREPAAEAAKQSEAKKVRDEGKCKICGIEHGSLVCDQTAKLSQEIRRENGEREQKLWAKCSLEQMTRSAVLRHYGDPAKW